MTFYFYDLETSGLSPREARIMQFAGQRTDENLQPVGEPHNILIKMTDDTLPDPDAIMITGITPQQTISDGVTEAEFLRTFHKEIATPGTVFVGFNTIRFDDEFMRFLHYRNFYDAYEWQYTDSKSRWDFLDVVRMTRALRPDGINWPFDAEGKPVNRLELLTALNKIEHSNAHDALADVRATIAVAQLIKSKQPKLFDFLLEMRNKQKVEQLVRTGEPFIYSSGRYDNRYEKTTAAVVLCDNPTKQGVLVYDLRYDPEQFARLSEAELLAAMTFSRDESALRLPVKALQFNRCPAVAPLSVLDERSKQRIRLDPAAIKTNLEKLKKTDLAQRVLETYKEMDENRRLEFASNESDVDARLYDGFFDNSDRSKMSVLRAVNVEELKTLDLSFKDDRLNQLLPLYKARNFPTTLSDEERAKWEDFKQQRLTSGAQTSRIANYFGSLARLAATPSLTPEKRYILEELQLYGQSLIPVS